MKKLLLVIDMQKDFIDGALGARHKGGAKYSSRRHRKGEVVRRRRYLYAGHTF